MAAYAEPISSRPDRATPYWVYAVVIGAAARLLLAYAVVLFQPGLAGPVPGPPASIPAADVREGDEAEGDAPAAGHAWVAGDGLDRLARIVAS